MIKVVIADDHKIVLDGLRMLLDQEDNIETVGEAANGLEVIGILDEHQVDVAVLDIEMPKINGIEATKTILEDNFIFVFLVHTHISYVSNKFRVWCMKTFDK